MTIFYDPQSRKPKVWIFVAFMLVPLVVIIIFLILGHQQAQKKNFGTQEEQ